MKKYLVIIIVLLFINLYAASYLKKEYTKRKAYEFSYIDDNLYFQNDELVFNDIDDYRFDKYFSSLSFNNNEIKNRINYDNKQIIVLVNDDEYKYEYKIIEPEIITKIETVYVDRIIEQNIYNSPDYSDNIYCSKDYFYFESGISISEIIDELSNCVDSDSFITCDYSSLNPNIPGIYNVRFFNDIDSVDILVEIY